MFKRVLADGASCHPGPCASALQTTLWKETRETSEEEENKGLNGQGAVKARGDKDGRGTFSCRNAVSN